MAMLVKFILLPLCTCCSAIDGHRAVPPAWRPLPTAALWRKRERWVQTSPTVPHRHQLITKRFWIWPLKQLYYIKGCLPGLKHPTAFSIFSIWFHQCRPIIYLPVTFWMVPSHVTITKSLSPYRQYSCCQTIHREAPLQLHCLFLINYLNHGVRYLYVYVLLYFCFFNLIFLSN